MKRLKKRYKKKLKKKISLKRKYCYKNIEFYISLINYLYGKIIFFKNRYIANILLNYIFKMIFIYKYRIFKLLCYKLSKKNNYFLKLKNKGIRYYRHELILFNKYKKVYFKYIYFFLCRYAYNFMYIRSFYGKAKNVIFKKRNFWIIKSFFLHMRNNIIYISNIERILKFKKHFFFFKKTSFNFFFKVQTFRKRHIWQYFKWHRIRYVKILDRKIWRWFKRSNFSFLKNNTFYFRGKLKKRNFIRYIKSYFGLKLLRVNKFLECKYLWFNYHSRDDFLTKVSYPPLIWNISVSMICDAAFVVRNTKMLVRNYHKRQKKIRHKNMFLRVRRRYRRMVREVKKKRGLRKKILNEKWKHLESKPIKVIRKNKLLLKDFNEEQKIQRKLIRRCKRYLSFGIADVRATIKGEKDQWKWNKVKHLVSRFRHKCKKIRWRRKRNRKNMLFNRIWHRFFKDQPFHSKHFKFKLKAFKIKAQAYYKKRICLRFVFSKHFNFKYSKLNYLRKRFNNLKTFIESFHLRLDYILIRLGLINSLFWARWIITNNYVLVNNQTRNCVYSRVNMFDCIEMRRYFDIALNKKLFFFFEKPKYKKRFWKQWNKKYLIKKKLFFFDYLFKQNFLKLNSNALINNKFLLFIWFSINSIRELEEDIIINKRTLNYFLNSGSFY